jgi:hypothetical protein
MNQPMDIPMHRFKYTKLTQAQIEKKLAQTAAGPECASELSDVLAGKSLKIVTEKGPVLNYRFKDKRKLTLTEDGGAAVEAGYGALPLKQMVFFSHMIPKTPKGYNVFVDLDTNLATVFEVWFCGGKDAQGQPLDDREVQREIYFGYIETTGGTAPEKLHRTTNRLEGTGFYWKQDRGIETLDLYPSIVSSNFVELTRHADDLSYCSPSDYIMVDDNIFIYERTECEFSGIMTMYVMDLFTETQAGMRLGFNEHDELEYYMFLGTGKIVGQLTSLAPFDEHGENPGAAMGAKAKPGQQPAAPAKGQRTVYRPARSFTNMTEEEVHQAAEKSTRTFSAVPEGPQAEAGMMGGNLLPFSDLLVGKEFTLHYDNEGPGWEYKVTDMYNLQWRKKGDTRWQEETYRAFEADEKLLFFAHIVTGSRPRACRRIALDMTNGLTTCVLSQMGTEYYGNEVSYRAVFGAVEMEGVPYPKYVRHEFTDELAGRGFTRTYSDQMTSMHLYTTPHSSSWTIYTGNQTLGMQWCAPALYVKIRPGVYIFDLVEEGCNGAETCIIENEKTKRACGFGFSGGARGVGLNTIGAIARDIGRYDLKEFFGPKARIEKGV